MAESIWDMDASAEDAFEAEELESLKAALAYLLLKNTELDTDTVYSLVFKGGEKIIWH